MLPSGARSRTLHQKAVPQHRDNSGVGGTILDQCSLLAAAEGRDEI